MPMHTVKVVSVGFGLLAICVMVGRVSDGSAGMAKAAIAFLPLWLLGSGVNMYLGVKNAGYTISEELPVAAGVFGGPALIAVGLWWKLH
jgi:hypothetical protein